METGSTNYTEPEALSDTSHFDDIRVDGEPLAPGNPDGVSASGVMDRETFQGAFCSVFDMGSAFSGLQSVAIDEAEKPKANACADALYDTALEVPWLRFLVEPTNPWLQRALVVGMFTVPKVIAVRNELAAPKRTPVAPSDAGEQTETARPSPYDWAGEHPRKQAA